VKKFKPHGTIICPHCGSAQSGLLDIICDNCEKPVFSIAEMQKAIIKIVDP
jgi:hypothetical protein